MNRAGNLEYSTWITRHSTGKLRNMWNKPWLPILIFWRYTTVAFLLKFPLALPCTNPIGVRGRRASVTSGFGKSPKIVIRPKTSTFSTRNYGTMISNTFLPHGYVCKRNASVSVAWWEYARKRVSTDGEAYTVTETTNVWPIINGLTGSTITYTTHIPFTTGKPRISGLPTENSNGHTTICTTCTIRPEFLSLTSVWPVRLFPKPSRR